MISDLLVLMSHLKREADEPLSKPEAIEAVVEHADRDVSDAERQELESLINDGWLDE